MKIIGLLAVIVVAAGSAVFADDNTSVPQSQLLLTAKEVTQAHAQELSRILVQLKLQEIAAQHAMPLDNLKISLIQAQQKAVREELLDLVLAPLELELKEDSTKYASGHQKIIQLQKRIEETKALLSGVR